VPGRGRGLLQDSDSLTPHRHSGSCICHHPSPAHHHETMPLDPEPAFLLSNHTRPSREQPAAPAHGGSLVCPCAQRPLASQHQQSLVWAAVGASFAPRHRYRHCHHHREASDLRTQAPRRSSPLHPTLPTLMPLLGLFGQLRGPSEPMSRWRSRAEAWHTWEARVGTERATEHHHMTARLRPPLFSICHYSQHSPDRPGWAGSSHDSSGHAVI